MAASTKASSTWSGLGLRLRLGANPKPKPNPNPKPKPKPKSKPSGGEQHLAARGNAAHCEGAQCVDARERRGRLLLRRLGLRGGHPSEDLALVGEHDGTAPTAGHLRERLRLRLRLGLRLRLRLRLSYPYPYPYPYPPA